EFFLVDLIHISGTSLPPAYPTGARPGNRPAVESWLPKGLRVLLHLQVGPGQADGDPGAPARLGVDGDGVAQAAADLTAEVEADAGGAALQPAVAAGEALVKDPGQVLPADAHAVVGDDQILPPGVHRHAAAGGVLHRVGQDLLHHQLEPLLVGEDGEVRL